MTCSCDVTPISFAVPETLRECAPDGSDGAAICPRCLTTWPADGAPEEPDFDRLSASFPDGAGGVALALALGSLDSLATNRRAIETALDHAERAGTDPLLAMDRLGAEPSVEPAIDLDRRRSQLESLRY